MQVDRVDVPADCRVAPALIGRDPPHGSGVPEAVHVDVQGRLGDAVRLSSPVTSVSNWQEGQGPVRLETPSGTVEADRVIMAMGGLVSLSDRRLRLGVAARRREQPT